MSRLLSIYFSLSETEVLRLRSDTMRAAGVSYLVSTDQSYLLRLACAEVMDDLDRAVATAARLAARCRSPVLRRLDRLYADLKLGSPSAALGKLTDKRVKKMEKLVAATARLSEEMEAVGGMEAEENRLVHRLCGPIPAAKPLVSPAEGDPTTDLKARRQRVMKLKEDSLWSVSSDKSVRMMARAAAAALARASTVFSAAVPGLLLPSAAAGRRSFDRFQAFKFSSGMLERKRLAAAEVPMRNSCPMGSVAERSSWSRMMSAAEPRTVGAQGLAVRYADVVAVAEMMLAAREAGTVDEVDRRQGAAARENVYAMLPAAVKAAVRGKLRDTWREAEGSQGDEGLARGWREAVVGLLRWLGPMAADTRRWHVEHSLDRRQRYGVRPRTLLIQTLHFADREKTEAAIVEVLAGLSCVCWYDDGRRRSPPTL